MTSGLNSQHSSYKAEVEVPAFRAGSSKIYDIFVELEVENSNLEIGNSTFWVYLILLLFISCGESF